MVTKILTAQCSDGEILGTINLENTHLFNGNFMQPVYGCKK